ncbi:MAG: 50S ribosomal protein L15 [Parachlamydiaceae bacterium]|nr:50S ribosomal protein L15 [Parachlamydiaceae bacterium]
MTNLANLTDSSRPRKSVKRVGRGPGSGLGKTCGRGEKGAGSRSGYKRRWGYEGGQFRTYAKMPIRGFNNTRFRQAYDSVNLGQINDAFEDGEVVNVETLAERGFLTGKTYGIKILGDGELKKKVTIEVAALSKSAQQKLEKANIPFTLV